MQVPDRVREIPTLGFGTYGRQGAEGIAAIRFAIETGYRHLDTAQSYDTEREVGIAIRESAVPRADIFVTTKIDASNLASGKVRPSLEKSLEALGLDQVDLTLIHWPAPQNAIRPEVYLTQLAAAQKAGLTRHIGVSNFTIQLLDESEQVLGPDAIICNQIELNPLFKNEKVVARCRESGIAVTCYQPVAQGRLSQDAVLCDIAARHEVTAEQIGLAWEWAKGHVAIPTSSRRERILAHHAARRISLSPEEIAAIDAIPDGPRQIDFHGSPDWD